MQNLDGNQIAERYSQEHTRDKKYPIISFPSGVERGISLRGEDENDPHINIFGKIELPYYQSRDEAYSHLQDTHGQQRYLQIDKVGESRLNG